MVSGLAVTARPWQSIARDHIYRECWHSGQFAIDGRILGNSYSASMSTLTDEISRRRTFAIISHPDAGKTTLTE
jgi:hypothetical protein